MIRIASLFILFLPTISLADDALDLVNQQRAARGLPPYQRDEGLTIAAQRAADHRAFNRIIGHTGNDFQFLPPGVSADAAGCAAWPDGFGACCMFESWHRAGAAWAIGRDGLKYCHLFVQGGGGSSYQRETTVTRTRTFLRRR